MQWYLESIECHLLYIKELFAKNCSHRHANNYLKHPLFEYTRFSRMCYDYSLIYYSAGIERPEYNGSIRIMSRHTRDRNYPFGGMKADLNRGLETLDLSTKYALNIGYSDIWVSREENPQLLYYFQKYSNYTWLITYEKIPKITRPQWILRLKN